MGINLKNVKGGKNLKTEGIDFKGFDDKSKRDNITIPDTKEQYEKEKKEFLVKRKRYSSNYPFESYEDWKDTKEYRKRRKNV